MKNQVYISLAEYTRLKQAEHKLEALEANGVDNWVGFPNAMDDYNDEGEDYWVGFPNAMDDYNDEGEDYE